MLHCICRWVLFVFFVSVMRASVCADAASTEPRTYFPPQLSWLVVWSSLFRCVGTFSNYLAHVKTGCIVVNACVKVC